MKKIIVTGVPGQDGSNMCEFLLENLELKKVYGVKRHTSTPNLQNIKSFMHHKDFQLVNGDLTDSISIDRLIKEIKPDFFINFAANSFVGCSWDMPEQVFDTNTMGVLRVLESIKKFRPTCRFYSAGSSEEFGNVDYTPQDINHPIKPRSPYGASKASARHLVKVYRESYNLHAIHGILFNHEGLRRGEEFVTRKITKGVARIKGEILKHIESNFQARVTPIELGNLYAKRDWSDSEDFIRGVWLMLNQSKAKDYILSSGETHSIKEFVEKAFQVAGIAGTWEGEGLAETFRWAGYSFLVKESDDILVKINPDFYRPADVEILCGDSTPIREELGWKPQISFDMLVKRMVELDIELSKNAIPSEK